MPSPRSIDLPRAIRTRHSSIYDCRRRGIRAAAACGGRRTPVGIFTGDYLLDEAALGEPRALRAIVYFEPLWHHELIAFTELLLRDDK